jgi:hypothetical protein
VPDLAGRRDYQHVSNSASRFKEGMKDEKGRNLPPMPTLVDIRQEGPIGQENPA